MLNKMHGTSFEWNNWGGGSISDLGITDEYESLVHYIDIIQKYAIGWCPGGETICRPRPNDIAIMFILDSKEVWFHITKEEFDGIFGEENLPIKEGGE